MARAVSLQVLVTFFVVLIAAAIGGKNAAVSAGLGGAACVVPNALFALRLSVAAMRPGGVTALGFFVAEFFKVAVTVALLVLIAQNYRGLHWLALIVGVIASLKSYFLMFVFVRR